MYRLLIPMLAVVAGCTKPDSTRTQQPVKIQITTSEKEKQFVAKVGGSKIEAPLNQDYKIETDQLKVQLAKNKITLTIKTTSQLMVNGQNQGQVAPGDTVEIIDGQTTILPGK